MVGAALLEALASPHKIATASNCLSPEIDPSINLGIFIRNF